MPETVLCTFRVKPGQEDALLALCRQHEEVLRKLDLCTDQPAVCYRGVDEGTERPFLIKIFQWKNPEALQAARAHPDVQILWEAMEPCCEPRDGRPSMEFPHVETIPL